MKFFSLPIGIWAISLLVSSASAAPADAKPKAKKPKKPPAPPIGQQLTLGDFNSTIEHDFWFVEFYSPSCPHCKKFAPTWKEFTESQKDVPKLHFAQVNCLAQGDLCNAQGVKGYPELNFFRDGARLGQFDDERLIPKMTTWLKDQMDKANAPASSSSSTTSTTTTSSSSEAAAPSPTESPAQPALVDQAKDEVKQYEQIVHEHENDDHSHDHDEEEVEQPVLRSNVNPTGSVLSLDPKTFNGAIAEGPIFIKFFAPWC
ncbi:thioredoxin-like protein, partial [Exidia glandulosa HHB12029]